MPAALLARGDDRRGV
jgi:hypothetical protein